MSQFYFGKTPHRVIYTNSGKESKEFISVLECSVAPIDEKWRARFEELSQGRDSEPWVQ